MWHTIEFVAKSRGLNAEALRQFAIRNEGTYGVIQEHGSVEVNTWHVDRLIKDFRELVG